MPPTISEASLWTNGELVTTGFVQIDHAFAKGIFWPGDGRLLPKPLHDVQLFVEGTEELKVHEIHQCPRFKERWSFELPAAPRMAATPRDGSADRLMPKPFKGRHWREPKKIWR